MSSTETNDSETIEINGHEYNPDTVKQGVAILRNSHSSMGGKTVGGATITEDGAVLRELGEMFDGERDIYQTLGYTKDLQIEDYRAKFERGGIARRIVTAYPSDTWKTPPEVTDHDGQSESEFEEQTNQLIDETLGHYWKRLDIVSGIGEFGLMFLGVADGEEFASEVNEGQLNGPDDLEYVSVFGQDAVHDWDLGKDVGRDEGDERYNKPVYYDVDFSDRSAETTEEDIKKIHHSRVIHVPTNPLESDLKGDPRLKPVFNRVEDFNKVIGGSAEMFWSGADRKIVGSVKDGYADLSQEDLAGTKEDLKRLVHDLQSHMLTTGMDFEVLGGSEPDPTGVVSTILDDISGTVDIPQNKLVGNETGERATTQDRRNWFDSVETRRENTAGPRFVRPTINRLSGFGILPDPRGGTFDVEWQSLFTLTESEETSVQLERSKVVKNIVPKGNTDMFPGGLEAVLEYVDSGELPDPEEVEVPEPQPTGTQVPPDQDPPDQDPPGQPPGQEGQTTGETPEAQSYFRDAFDIPEDSQPTPVSNETRYGEGDIVTTPDGKGVVAEPIKKTIEFDGETIEGSDKQPVYAVALADPPETRFYHAADLNKTSFDIEGDHSADELGETTPETNMDDSGELEGPVTNIGFDSWPDSWEDADTPARVIALDAWSSMGGSWRGCFSEIGSKRICSAFKDEMLQTTEWRGKF